MFLRTIERVKFIGAPPNERFIPNWKLQDRFNDGRYWERALNGEFVCQIKPYPKRRDVANRPDEVPGSISIMASFYALVNEHEAVFVFRADVVVRPDGSFGGRSAIEHNDPRPDPKKLVESGITYCAREPTTAEQFELQKKIRARHRQEAIRRKR